MYLVTIARARFFEAWTVLGHPAIHIIAAGSLWVDMGLSGQQCDLLEASGFCIEKTR